MKTESCAFGAGDVKRAPDRPSILLRGLLGSHAAEQAPICMIFCYNTP
jgi:hypothetical protein